MLESPLAVRDADLANDAVDVESPHAEAPPAPLMAGTSAPWPMAFGLFALAVGVAGWVSNFAMVFFPQATQQATSPYDQAPQPVPLAYVLMSCGIWLLALALLMLAVLFVVPRRWRHVWPEAGDDAIQSVPTGRGPSAARGLVFGVVVVAASVYALVAPYMFPMSTGVQTVQSGDGGTYSQQAWAGLAQGLLIPFMLAGMIVLGWGCIHLAVTIRPVGGQTEAGD